MINIKIVFTLIYGKINEFVIFILLLILTLFSRFETFKFSTLDWDESLYFLMAERLRAGFLPYVALWDNKPIGIYVIFAAFQMVFGDSLATMRIATIFAVTASGFLVYKILNNVDIENNQRSQAYAIFGGTLYILCSLAEGGVVSNTELFMSSFVCLAVYSSINQKQPIGGRPYLTGLAMGAACIVKYVAIFEAPIPLIILMMKAGVKNSSSFGYSYKIVMKEMSGIVIRYAMGGASFFFLIFLIYWIDGYLNDFVEASLLSNLRRIESPFSIAVALRALRDETRVWPLFDLAGLILFIRIAWQISTSSLNKIWCSEGMISFILIAWIAGAAAGVCSAKSFYPHYFLQMLPVMSITTALVLKWTTKLPPDTSLLHHPRSISFYINPTSHDSKGSH